MLSHIFLIFFQNFFSFFHPITTLSNMVQASVQGNPDSVQKRCKFEIQIKDKPCNRMF